MNEINEDNLIKTGLTNKLTVDGITKAYDVYKIKIGRAHV